MQVRYRIKRLTSALLVCGVVLLASPVWAQDADMRSLIDEITRLRKDMADLQRHVYRGETPPAGALPAPSPAANEGAELAARLEVRLGQLEDDMRGLTGQVEEVAHGISQVSDRLDKLVADVDYRLTAIERAQAEAASVNVAAAPATAPPADASSASATAAPAPAPAPPPGTLGTLTLGPSAPAETQGAASLAPALPPGTPKEQYKYAYDLLRQMDFAEAERALKAFIEAHPNDELTGNAFYWLAETFYVRGNYEQAVAYFARGYQDYSDSRKAPDNLLKLAMSLAKLGRKEDACVTFKELDTRFPDASPTIKQRAVSERRRIGCG